MLIKDYISKDFPAFETSSFVDEALNLVNDFGFSHIFIKQKGIYQGALLKEVLEENPGVLLSEVSIHSERFAVSGESTLLDTIKIFNTFDANILPVINPNEKYLGYISYEDVFKEFSKYPLFSENGAVLTVETSLKTYSFTEIAKIVESNNCRFFGAFINSIEEDRIQITMRISHENLSSVDESFERFGYSVVRKFYTDEKEEMLKDRYQFMQKYLQI